jgi:lipopolysaccharide export system protein LptA
LRLALTFISIVFPAISLAGGQTDVELPEKKTEVTSLLPNGSELKGVMLPRYDENHKLVGVLKSKAITLVNDNQMAGTGVSVEFFDADQTSGGRIDMKKVMFDKARGILSAKEPIDIKSDKLTANGSGLYYSFEESKGFLLGPATTTIIHPTRTAMNSNPSKLRATALALAMAAEPANAAPPETAAQNATANKETRASLTKDLDDSVAALTAAKNFIVQADLPTTSSDPILPPDKPLEVKTGAGDTVIHCEGGMYFDAEQGVLVYLKNVTVKDPRFNLSGANEVKVFFGKKAPKEKPNAKATDDESEKSKLGGKLGANFGEVEKIVATGAVRLEQTATEAGKEPIKASGAIFTYNVKDDQATISGGFPWVIQGTTYLRAKQANLILRLSPKAGTFSTEGDWEMGGNLEPKK